MSEKKDYLFYTPEIFVTMDNNARPFIILVYDDARKAVVYLNGKNTIKK